MRLNASYVREPRNPGGQVKVPASHGNLGQERKVSIIPLGGRGGTIRMAEKGKKFDPVLLKNYG